MWGGGGAFVPGSWRGDNQPVNVRLAGWVPADVYIPARLVMTQVPLKGY